MPVQLISRLICLILLARCDSEILDQSQVIDAEVPFETSDPIELSESVLPLNKSYGHYSSEAPVVITDIGDFIGSSFTDGKGVQYEQFLGLRYAEPPVGPLRFKKPLPWRGSERGVTYEETEFCPPCMQPKKAALESSGMLPSEDCLCLNIYRPAGCTKGSKKPVLVYIHGSYFLEGSAANTNIRGGYLAHYRDLIVVTMNYRLGAFGWLYGEDENVPGNMGFYDILMVVHWVRDYIDDFGGNPDAITIGGHGAGATIATAFLMEPEVPRDLFRSVMILSPDYTLTDFVNPYWQASRKSKDFAHLVGCGEAISDGSLELSKQTLDCLRNTDARKLAEESYKIPKNNVNGICSWNQLFPFYSRESNSWDYRLKGDLLARDKLIYIGGVPIESSRSFEGYVAESYRDGSEIIINEYVPFIKDKSTQNLQAIVDFYLKDLLPGNSYGERTTNALDDLCNACTQLNLVRDLMRHNTVYTYFFTYVASRNRDSRKRKYGPFHADDTPFNFGVPLRDVGKYSDYDRAVSLEVMSVWADFIHGRKMKWPPRKAPNYPLGHLEGDAKRNFYRRDSLADLCPRAEA